MTMAAALTRRTKEEDRQTSAGTRDAIDSLRNAANLDPLPVRTPQGNIRVVGLFAADDQAGAATLRTHRDQGIGAALSQRFWQAIDRTELRDLAHLLARYPTLATGIFLPTLILTVLLFLSSGAVALLLGVFAAANGVIFAMTAASQMARDGLDFSTSSQKET